MDEIKFILKHHASEINQIESAIGRPLVFGAIKAFNAQDWRDEVEITLDGQPVGADFESFISGVLWLLKQ